MRFFFFYRAGDPFYFRFTIIRSFVGAQQFLSKTKTPSLSAPSLRYPFQDNEISTTLGKCCHAVSEISTTARFVTQLRREKLKRNENLGSSIQLPSRWKFCAMNSLILFKYAGKSFSQKKRKEENKGNVRKNSWIIYRVFPKSWNPSGCDSATCKISI